MYKKLFSEGKIGNVSLRNRVVMTAMGVDLSDPNGCVNEKTIAYYRERARNGVGLIVTEYCRVNEKDGACATGQLSLSHDSHVPGMTRLVSAIHEEGAKVFIQLHHPGRQSAPIFPTFWPLSEKIGRRFPGYWQWLFNKLDASVSIDFEDNANIKRLMKLQRLMRPVLAPSVIPTEEDGQYRYVKYRAFRTSEIKRLEKEFLDAAVRAKNAGADGVELHAAHGYLLNQFLSPHYNRRTDCYGGSTENRCLILKELIEMIHEQCGRDFPVTVRLTVNEHFEVLGCPGRGITIEEGVRIARNLEAYGAAAINVSVGGCDTNFLVTESMRRDTGWRKSDIMAVRKAVSLPLIAVDMIRTPEQAEAFLAEGVQDFIGLGRPLLADPLWVRKAYDGTPQLISRCVSCLTCMDLFMADMLNDKPIECALCPRTCHESEYELIGKENGDGRRIVVVGAGPAGLMAARELSLRGFSVIVLEKEAKAGGQIELASRPPYKQKIAWCTEDLEAQVKNLGVEIRYSTEATEEMISGFRPYAVFLATGAYAAKPAIEGADADYVTTVTPVLDGSISWTDKKLIVVGSGMTGLETAELLVGQGNSVTVLEMADKVASGASGINILEIKEVLSRNGVSILTGRKLKRISDHVVYCETAHGEESYNADGVVLSLGSRRRDELKTVLEEAGLRVIVIGDAEKVGRIHVATKAAFLSARALD